MGGRNQHTHPPFEKGNQLTLKLNDEVTGQIVAAIEAGAYMETAAAYAGIAQRTLYNWLKRGRDGDEPYATFTQRVEEALAASEMSDLAHIANARPTHWQAAAWHLERRWPQKYGRRTRIEADVNVTARPFLDYSKLNAEELETLVALMEKARPDPDDPALGNDGRAAADLVETAAAEEDAEDADWEEVGPGEIEAA